MYRNSTVIYEVVEILEHGYTRQSQRTMLLSTDTAIKPGPYIFGTVVQEILDRADVMDEALRYLTTAIFNVLYNLLKNSHL